MSPGTFNHLSAQIVGTSTGDIWTQVLTLSHFQVALTLAGPDSLGFGHQIVRLLEEEDQKLAKSNLASLSAVAEKIKKNLPPEIELSLACVLPAENALYLISLDGAIFLYRREKLVKILEGKEKASGFLNDGDLFILGSRQFFQALKPPILLENLDHFSPEEIAERLTPKILETEENAGCAALILYFQKQDGDLPDDLSGRQLEPEALGFFQKLRRLKFIRPNFPRSQKTLLTVALFLILMLVLSIFFGVNKTRESEQTRKFTELYHEALSNYDEGRGLVELNDALARGRLEEAAQIVGEIKKLSLLKSDQEKKVGELEEKIKMDLTILSRVYKIGSLPLFWETKLIREGSEGVHLAISKDSMAILDQKNRLVFLLSIKTKAVKSFDGQDLKGEPRFLGLDNDNVYVLTGEGVAYFKEKNKTQLLIAKDDAWGEIIALATYGGNLYLLDKGKSEGESKQSQIWRYTGVEGGFGSPRPYFASDIKPDLSPAQDLAIDGSVWVLLPGEILRLTQGRPDKFVVSGLEGDLGAPSAIFTDQETKNLYLLDLQNKRVLVLGKDGAYQAQYVSEEIGQARDLIVSEEEKKIFLLGGSKVYYIELKL